MLARRSSRFATLIAFLVAALAWSEPSRAATFTVATTVDSLSGPLSLRQAVAAASGNGQANTIVLQTGATYPLTVCDEALTYTGTASLNIESKGAGATIQQTCPHLGTLVTTAAPYTSVLTIDGITVSGGTSDTQLSGAAIHTKARLVLQRSTVTGTTQTDGCVVLRASTVTLEDSNIVNNPCSGIRDSGTVLVRNSVIADNTGHGVFLTDILSVTVENSQVTGNGGVGVGTTDQGHGTVTVTSSVVSDNGLVGVLCTQCASIVITGSRIENNGGKSKVGGFFESGGGVLLDAGTNGNEARGVTITDSVIRGNTAFHPGGGVYVRYTAPTSPIDGPSTSITSSEISENRTMGDELDGGGIAVSAGRLTVKGSTIAHNVAGAGGVLLSAGGGLAFSRVKDSASRANITIEDSTFEGNSASGGGGGAAIATFAKATIKRSEFLDNSAGRQGGGAAACSQEGSISDSTFTGNEANTGAGLLVCPAAFGSTNTIQRSTFANNTASYHGGGVSVDLTAADIVNSTITGNFAQEGGGLSLGLEFAAVETVTLHHTTLSKNQASDGANVTFFGGTLLLRASVVAEAGGAGNCHGFPASIVSLGYNFLSDDSCGHGPNDTISSHNPRLAKLKDNGGLTPTREPARTSPLAGLVPRVKCLLTEDQRGVARPRGHNCEPGAVEIAEH